ncbi:ERI1 exoribonuclease 2 isoform X2 [Willisornis vidua]|uniref:ERI1 exoribonuclease 2 isoform X2 n=1 Tax=Willisornis vidua TaxID=1566151 RepID=A0ABQ9DUD9_9PASS|nr:ERI1 exoribonuclease 2 isoform X2 [Willisornis vidua]
MATKRLARRLGLARSSARARAGPREAAGQQRFAFLVVLDFEATCWRDGERRGPEIIEFPAVLLNTSTGEIESEFHTYVQPQEHPILSEFCTELTGITQSYYNRKPKGLNGALQDLGIAFVGREHSGLDDSRNTARLAWRLICDGCVLKVTKSLDKTRLQSNLISRTLTVNFTDKTPLGSKSRPETCRDGTCETNCLAENKHNGIAGNKINSNVQTEEQQTTCTSADVSVPSSTSRTEFHAQAQSLSAASTDRFPVPLELAQPSPSPAPTGTWQGLSNGQLLVTARHSPPVQGPGLVLVSTTIPSVTLSSEEISTSSDCLSLLTDWEDVALIPESQYEQNSDSVQLKDDSSIDSLIEFEEKTIAKQLAVTSSDNQNLEKSVVPMEPLKSVIYKSPDTTIYNVGTVQRQTSNFSAFKLPSAKVNTISAQSALTGNYSTPLEIPKRKPTSPKPFPPAKKQSFAIYEEKTSSLDHSLPLKNLTLPKVSPAVLNSTVNLNQSLRVVRNGKPTPPLCNCGRRAKRLCVSNAGPNHGKAFFCCPVGKQDSKRKGCGYFKWEYAVLKGKSNGLTLNADDLTSLGTVSSNLGSSSNKNNLCLRPSMRT